MFPARPCSQPHFGGVSIQFFWHSRLYGVIKNNTLSKRAGEPDPSSATATCGTIHRRFHLFNQYLNEPFYTLGPRDTKICKTPFFSFPLRVRFRELTSQTEREVPAFLASFLHMEELEVG